MWYNWIIPLQYVALGLVIGIGLLWLAAEVMAQLAPRTAAIAAATAKESYSQPLFYAVLALGFVFIWLSVFIPYSTFGDDIKVMKDTALMAVLVLSIFLAVSSSSTSVADELEGRTALTVLSKPVSRREFVIGKFFGVLTPVVILYLVLGSTLLAATSYKVKHERRELSLPPPKVVECRDEIYHTAPALALAFLETVMLTSISVAVSMRLTMVPNLLICATVYLVGHMLPLIVQSSVGKLPIVGFIGQLLSTVLPVLEHFNIQAAIASGRDATLTLSTWLQYLSWAGGYCLLYATIMLLVALLLFEDRDLT